MAGTPSSSRSPISLFSETALTGAAASIDLQDIPQTYRHLLGILTARSNDAADNVTTRIRLNNDAGANYDFSSEQWNGLTQGTFESLAATFGNIAGIPAAAAAAGNPGCQLFFIPGYRDTTFRKLIFALGIFAVDDATGTARGRLFASVWKNTAAVTRVTLLPSAGNFIAGTRLDLYGL